VTAAAAQEAAARKTRFLLDVRRVRDRLIKTALLACRG
jgi:hypothetical protein